MMRFSLVYALWIGTLILTNAQNNTPKPLLIYYGFPSKLNNLTTAQDAANAFSQYAYVVWPDNIEDSQVNPVESGKSKDILNLINPNTRVYGYVSLAFKANSPQLSLAVIHQKLDRISAFGFKGVFFDECGYLDNVSRDRLTDAVAYAHLKNLDVMANTLYSTCLFDNAYNPTYNPSTKLTPFTSRDGYLFESDVVLNGNYFRFAGENGSQYDEWDFWRAKSDTLRQFQKQLNFKVFSITTPDYQSDYDASKYAFAWYCAWLWGHEATGWSEQTYSSDVSGNTSRNMAPFRIPPAITDPGSRFLTEFTRTGNEHFRFTNKGRIWANTQTKQALFTSCGTVSSYQSGSWTDAASWTGSRVPYPCDVVSVSSNQVITVIESVMARKLMVGTGAKFSLGMMGKITVAGE